VGATTGIGSLPHEDVDDALCLPGVPMWSVPTVGSSRARDPAFRGTRRDGRRTIVGLRSALIRALGRGRLEPANEVSDEVVVSG
jgi:hypothetical protein